MSCCATVSCSLLEFCVGRFFVFVYTNRTSCRVASSAARNQHAEVRRVASGPGGTGLLGQPIVSRRVGDEPSVQTIVAAALSLPPPEAEDEKEEEAQTRPEQTGASAVDLPSRQHLGPRPFNPRMMASELVERSRRHQHAAFGGHVTPSPLISFVGRVDIMTS